MNVKPTLLALAMAGILSACGSSPSGRDIAKEEIAVQKMRDEADQERRERQQKEAKRLMAELPSWAIEPPRADERGIYAVGAGESTRYDIAIKKAKLTGEFGLAQQYTQIISGQERSYQKDSGRSGGINEQFSQLIEKLVDRVPIVGFEVVKHEVKPINGSFHSFVLMKLPYDQYNKQLLASKAEERNAEAKEAFAEMEQRLERYRASVKSAE